MTHQKRSWTAATLAATAASLISFTTAVAGPPLLCHSFDIGDAKSLAWGNDNWDNAPLTVDDKAFVSQVLEILSPEASIIVRMETIRRATIHAAEHPQAGINLLAALRARWSATKNAKSPDGLAYFDYGYILATYSQMNIVTEYDKRADSGNDRKPLSFDEDQSAYELISKALELDDEKGSIEFALALLTSHPSRPEHHTHVKNALGCVGEKSLLASNLVKHFGGEDGRTVQELRKTYWSQESADGR